MPRIDQERLIARIRAAIKSARDRREENVYVRITVRAGSVVSWEIKQTRVEHSGMEEPGESGA